MLAHLLNERILLEQETSSKNAIGTPTESYVSYRYTYANVKYGGGGTEYNEIGDNSYTHTEFTIRYNPDINYKFRVNYNNACYKILHIERIKKNEGLRLVTIMFDEDGS